MAESLPSNGHIDTCELCPIHGKTAQKFFNKSNYKHQLTIHIGEALETLENFSKNSFDMIFIDADKINYIEYYKMAMILLKPRGVIILDNMLWSGDVLKPTSKESETLNMLNNIITDDKRNDNTLLPIRDGLMICIKK
jgi:caffeoyl-CoA O-methyltransferase